MSIANEITRIQQAKEDIKAALISKGCPVTNNMTIDEYADLLGNIDGKYDWSTQYLTFMALESGTFELTMPSELTFTSISYSTDNGATWTTTNYSDAMTITTPTITAGNKVLWKGTGNTMATSNSVYSYFSSTCKFTANGNVMSLLYGDNFSGQTDLTGKSNCFIYLFKQAVFLISAVNFILPATTLADKCYQQMFQGCTSLTTAPSLPATTLANYCYQQMFQGCTNLTTAPTTLPATTLANYCYQQMFKSCKSLTAAPSLPATTLAYNCYNGMFMYCTITTAPSLPATTLADNCYQQMFKGCKSLTAAPELPATTLANNCYNGMFMYCTSLTTAPSLPATTLTTGCYSSMFQGCTSLNYIKAMFTTAPSNSYTQNWVSGVASSGTFVKNSAATWNVTGVNGIPKNWTVETASS